MDEIVRAFARHQWVRSHGTPRVTVLVGARARALWQRWLELGELAGEVFDGRPIDRAIREAVARASALPALPVAVVVEDGIELAVWRDGRSDRLAALVDEGLVPDEPGPPADMLDARSAAEAALFAALEATPATAGRFELNGYLSVRFGSRAAEVDLLSRRDRIAVEIDGVHHFADPDCYRRDRRKDLLLQTQGLLVVRLLAEDVLRDVRGAVTVVCQALAYRRSSPP
jgi:hypothetical protein